MGVKQEWPFLLCHLLEEGLMSIAPKILVEELPKVNTKITVQGDGNRVSSKSATSKERHDQISLKEM